MNQNSFDSALTSMLVPKWQEHQRQNPNADPRSGAMIPLWNQWAAAARKDLRRQVYQETLGDLAAANVPGVMKRELDETGKPKATFIVDGKPYETPDDDELYGDFAADPNSPAHEYAVIRQNLFERGQPMPSWDEFEKNRPSKIGAAILGGFINANLAWESGAKSIGQWFGRTAVDFTADDETVSKTLGIDFNELTGALGRRGIAQNKDGGTPMRNVNARRTQPTNDAEILAKYDKYMLDLYEAQAKEDGDAWMRGARFASEVVSHASVDAMRMAAMGSDPTDVRDIRETYGRAQGGALVKAGEMTGSALGIIPYSLPALVSRNPRVAAMLTTPFYAMGHSGAWERRVEIYRDQLAAARANGDPEPAPPTIESLNAQSQVAGAVEFGSEYVFDNAQKGLMGLLGFGSKTAGVGKLGAQTVKKYGTELANSMARRQGRLGVAKAAALVGAGAVVEGAEEAIPEFAKEITDPLYIPKGYENDFLSEQSAEAIGTGFIAGFLMTGSATVAGAAVGKVSRAKRAERVLAEKAVGVASGIIQQKADRLAAERLIQNSSQARGATMALHQVEELAAGDRTVMFVSTEVAEATVTDDVKKRMEALGVPSRPVGFVNGMRVYAHADQIANVRQAIRDGNIGNLTGHPALKDPSLPAQGAIVVRNQSSQVLEVLPYSSSADADSAQPAIEAIAARSGNVVTRVSAEELPALSETMAVQMDTDARMRKIMPPSVRGETRQSRARGLQALKLDIEMSTSDSWFNGSREDAFDSNYLSAAEIDGAKNKDVEISVRMRPVRDSQLTDAERRIITASGSKPTIVDGTVNFTITRPDGTKRVIEKPIRQSGAYLSQSNPDGVYLIRENGSAFTARNAMAVLLHELRHQLVGRSRGGAKMMAQLMYMDPVLAMRGGIQYMRGYATESTMEMDPSTGAKRILSDEELVGKFAAMHAAAESILTDPTATEQERVAAKKARSEAESFAEEMAATQAEESTGQTLTAAAQWEPIYKNVQGMNARKFASWAAYHLTKAGWAGPWAKQALWELSQRQKGVMDAQLRIHDHMMREIEPKYREDMERNRQVMEGSRSQALPAVGAALGTAAAPIVAAAGDDDDEIAAAGKALEGIGSLPPDQKGEALSKIVSTLAALVPSLASATASITGTGTTGGSRIQPGKSQAPAAQPPISQAVPASEPAAEPAARPTAMTEAERESMYAQRGEPMFAMRRDIKENWVATSKAVDDGKLTTVYTGSPTGFMEFDSQRMGRTERPVSLGAATSSTTEDGMWFTSSKNVASDAAQISSVNMMPKVSRILNDKTKRLADELPEEVLRTFEENAGQPLKDYRVSPENLAEFMENDGDTYEGVIRGHAQFLSEMMENDPAAVAKIDQEFQGTDIAVIAAFLAGSRGGVMRGAHLKLENPLIVPFKTGELVSTDRGFVREDEPFVTQASDALDQMRANGNDGIIMEMPDGERRYFIRNPSQVQVIGSARDVREASMFAMRRNEATEARLASMLQGLPFRVLENDPRFDPANFAIDGVSKARFTEVTQPNLKSIAQADSVFHETSAVNARKMIPEFRKSYKRLSPIDVSTNPDIALGQGGRGVRIEFDSSRVNGNYGAGKPAQGFLEGRGLSEFKVDAAIRGSISAIEVNSPAVEKVIRKDPAVERMFDWANPENTQYGTRYRSMFAMRGKPMDPANGVGRQLAVDAIRALGATEEEIKATVLDRMKGGSREDTFLPEKVGGISDIVRFLGTRRSASGLRTLDVMNPKDHTAIARLMALEGVAHISAAKGALEWYDSTVRSMLAQAALIHPELGTDKNAQMVFAIGLAISSQGQNVEDNIAVALALYDSYKASFDPALGVGQFGNNLTKGTKKASQNKNLKLANKMLREIGLEGMRTFLAKQYTVKELRLLGYKPGGELVDEALLGSSVFGPKIGFGFLSNLMGNFDPITMDMWFMRTVLRLAGSLSKFNPKTYAKQRERFLNGVAQLRQEGDPAGIYASDIDPTLVARATSAKAKESSVRALARAVVKAHEKDFKNNRADYDSGKRKQTEMVLAAKTIMGSIDKPRDVAKSGGERRNLRAIVRMAVAQTNEITGLNIPHAAFQALIWYPEQELFKSLGAKLRVTSQDYAGAMTKQLKQRGFSDESIQAAIAGSRPKPTGPGGPGGTRGGGVRPAAGAAARRVDRVADGREAGDVRPSDQGQSRDTGVESQFSMRRGLRGAQDEAMLRYVDKFDEMLRYTRIAAQRGMNLEGLANPYTAARLLTDRMGAMQRASERRYADLLRRQYEAGVTLGEMDEFLTAQHAEERNIYVASINPAAFPDGGSGMFTADARNILANHTTTGRFAMLDAFANEWRAMLNDALVQRRDAGLVTQDLFNRLNARYQRYVPLRGAPAQIGDEDFEAWGEPGGSGLSTTGRGIPQAMGRQSDALGVTSQVAYVHEDAFRRIARNQVGQSFLTLVTAVADRAMAEVVRPRRRVIVNGEVRNVHDMGWMRDPRNFGVYVDTAVTINGHDYEPGDLVVIRINNRRLADAMTSPTLELRSFERALTNVNNVWRFMTTGMGNPAFAPVNMLRDIGQAVLNNLAQRGFVDTAQMLRRWPRAFLRVWTDNWINLEPSQTAVPQRDRRLTGSYARYVEAGGDMVGWRGNDLEAKRTDFEQLADRVARRDPNDRSLARTLLGWYSGFFAASETASRLAQFEQRVATGSNDYDAALAARDITVDFRKGGMAKPVLNTWYMFLNAGLQGTVNVAGAVARSLAIAPSLVMLGFVQAFMARTMGGDDEDTGQAKWDNIPDYEKTSNMYFFNPNGSGKHAKLPVPYGYNVFFSAGVRLEDVIYGRSTPTDMASGMLVDALNAFNPVGGSGITGGTGNVLTSLMPTMVRPLGELAINEDFSGRPIYPKQYGKFPKPDSAMFFDGTPDAYISTADWLNKATGGDEFESGSFDMSPDTMEYLVGYYFSGSGRMLNRLYKVASSGGDVNPNDVPVMRSFIGDASTDTRAISQRYNAIGAELAPAMRRLDAMEDENLPMETRSRAARGVTATQQELIKSLEATDKALSQLNKMLKGSEGETRKSLLETRRLYQKGLIRRKNELTDALRALE